ncbi:hypothetical protein EV1_003249 [Malus domestica]
MTANEYYKRFTDLSRYQPEVAANPVEMLRRFSESEEREDNQKKKDDKGRVLEDVLPMVNWGIGLCIVLRISRGPNSLICHHQCRAIKFKDLVVMSGYPQYLGGYTSYPPYSTDGSQWYLGG